MSSSPYFKKIYLYLGQNKLPSSLGVVREVDTQIAKHLLLDLLLFRIQNTHDEQNPALCIPKS